MIDSDLATLYGVETKYLNRQVRNNRERFPADFMFQLTKEEVDNLRCKIVTSSATHGGARYLPLVFTENGLAMLSGILKSPRAIQVNIAIMRIFTRLRSYLLIESELKGEFSELKSNTNKLFKIVFERLDAIEENIERKPPTKRKRIGLN